MNVYHGSNVIIHNPDIMHSFRPLDFGKGFYVTTVMEQAERWARRKMDFVCRCRDEKEDYLKYDFIRGKVANDKVFRVVDMYHSGIWDKERALKEIKVYHDYDQIAFVSQKAIDQLLRYETFYEVMRYE